MPAAQSRAVCQRIAHWKVRLENARRRLRDFWPVVNEINLIGPCVNIVLQILADSIPGHLTHLTVTHFVRVKLSLRVRIVDDLTDY